MRPVKPNFLNIPRAPQRPEDLVSWAQGLSTGLETFFGGSQLETPDRLLLGRAITQVVTDGFTVDPVEVFIDLVSSAAVTSSATVAIKAGSDVQLLIVQNRGTFNITFKHGAQLEFASFADFVLPPGRSMLVRWNGSVWVEVSNSFIGTTAGGDLSGTYPNPSIKPHATRHQDGGSDEVSVVGLSGLLADPQTPLAHDVSHENGGSDEINVVGLSGELADPQPPKAHKVSHQNGGSDELDVVGLSGLLADAQTPLGHHASHESGGTDSIKLDDLATPDDNTDLDATAARHGLLPKLSGNAAHVLHGDGSWS